MKRRAPFLLIAILGIAGLFVFAVKSNGQSVVYEKTFGSPYANFRPNAIAADNNGNIYITGRYETGLEFFKEVNGVTKYADTTLPYGTMMYLDKISSDGKLVKQVFLNAIEGLDLCVTKEGNIAVTGFTNNYRKENYTGDRTQGVYTALLTPDLKIYWWEIDSSQYNSTPEKIIETNDGNQLVLASSLIKKVPVSTYIDDDIERNRFILINKKGKILKDTSIYAMDQYIYDDSIGVSLLLSQKKRVIPPPSHLYGMLETDNGFLFSGESSSNPNTVYGDNVFFIMETDKKFNVLRTKQFKFNRDTVKYDIDDTWGYGIAKDDDRIILTGIAQYSDKESMIACLNNNFDTLYTRHFDGDLFGIPRTVFLPDHTYCFCNNTKSNCLNLVFMNDKGILKTMELGDHKIHDFRGGMCIKDGFVYLAAVRKDTLDKTYLAKIKLP